MQKYDKFYVYELVNSLGVVEYVGETTNPKNRFYNHTKRKQYNGNGNGKFYGRTDITLSVVNEFDNKKDAFNYQCELQKRYGFQTDADKKIQTGKNVGNIGYKISCVVRRKPIIAINIKTGEKINFVSIAEAARQLNTTSGNITKILNPNDYRKSACGYRFEYVK